jgi:RNA polymerase sigma-70 factor, ECF subfamily
MGTADKTTEAQFSQAWSANRPYLVNLAFGMLGDIGSAEDAVQEAFARLANADFNRIEDERGWLIVVTSRICLDQIHSARARRERAHDTSTIEFAGPPTAPATSVDPADRVTLDDEINLALLVVLDRLNPAERVVFVLHDIFQTPFGTIADTVGRPAASCRQLARRARMKIRSEGGRAGVQVDVAEQRMVTEQFIRACSDGDLAGLIQILDPDVSGDVDLGVSDERTGRVVHGSRSVARNLSLYFGSTTLVCNPVGGQSVVLAFAEQRLYGVILLTLDHGLIKKVHVIADPAKIDLLDSQLSGASSEGDR